MLESSVVLKEMVKSFVTQLADEKLDPYLAELPTFVRQDVLNEWIKANGRRAAIAQALMEMAKEELKDGTKISMLQYLWFKYSFSRLAEEDGEEPLDFGSVEETLLTDLECPEAKTIVAQIWSVNFIRRAHRRLLTSSIQR
jgi:hypothetical protein